MHLIIEYFSVISLKRFLYSPVYMRTRRISAVFSRFLFVYFQNSLRSRCARKQRVAIMGTHQLLYCLNFPPFARTMTMGNVIRVSVISPCVILCIRYIRLCVKYIGVSIRNPLPILYILYRIPILFLLLLLLL